MTHQNEFGTKSPTLKNNEIKKTRMEGNMPQDEVDFSEKEAYEKGIKRYYESANGIGKVDDERYTESRKLWRQYLAGELTSDELCGHLKKFEYKVVTLKEINLVMEPPDDRIFNE